VRIRFAHFLGRAVSLLQGALAGATALDLASRKTSLVPPI